MRNVSIQQSDGKPDIAFSSDGTLKSVELKIMNLRPDGRSNQPNQEQNLIWEEVSTTNSQKYTNPPLLDCTYIGEGL